MRKFNIYSLPFKPVDVRTLDQSLRLPVQLTQPFAFTSSDWSEDGSCEKNTSKIRLPTALLLDASLSCIHFNSLECFRPVQSHTKGEGQSVQPTIDFVDSKFQYVMRARDAAPKLSFHIPGVTKIH